MRPDRYGPRPAPAAKPAKPRQSNPERSAATREKILRATVDCLYSVGYAQTSTVLVTSVERPDRAAGTIEMLVVDGGNSVRQAQYR